MVIRPETCVAIRPESCVAIRPITRKKLCGNDCYKTNHSKFFRSLIFHSKIPRSLGVFEEKNFRFCFGFKTQYLQKVIFADLTFIRPITPKFRGGNDFYKTNHSKIHEIRPITPKSDWSYNHPPLYSR